MQGGPGDVSKRWHFLGALFFSMRSRWRSAWGRGALGTNTADCAHAISVGTSAQTLTLGYSHIGLVENICGEEIGRNRGGACTAVNKGEEKEGECSPEGPL